MLNSPDITLQLHIVTIYVSIDTVNFHTISHTDSLAILLIAITPKAI